MVIEQAVGARYAAYNGDAMQVLPSLPDRTLALSIYSPPFPELYQYSNDARDISNCATYEEGLRHYRFVVRELARLTMPGRLSCVHCMDLKQGGVFQRDFPGDIVRLHAEAGFHFFCRITIWKDPWLIARRTRMRSLMHKTIVLDSAGARVAGPDYVLVFRKGGVNPIPITHPNGLTDYAGATPIPVELLQQFHNYKGDQRKNRLSHWIWRQYASPVWTDIRTGRLLPYREARESDEEKHVCALQLDVIERCLTLWSNRDETILTPFMGVGSEVCGAVVNGRRGLGIELKPSYYRQALKNLARVEPGSWGDATNQEELDWGEADLEPEDFETAETVFTSTARTTEAALRTASANDLKAEKGEEIQT